MEISAKHSDTLSNRIVAKQKELARLRQAVMTRLQELQTEEAQLAMRSEFAALSSGQPSARSGEKSK